MAFLGLDREREVGCAEDHVQAIINSDRPFGVLFVCGCDDHDRLDLFAERLCRLEISEWLMTNTQDLPMQVKPGRNAWNPPRSVKDPRKNQLLCEWANDLFGENYESDEDVVSFMGTSPDFHVVPVWETNEARQNKWLSEHFKRLSDAVSKLESRQTDCGGALIVALMDFPGHSKNNPCGKTHFENMASLSCLADMKSAGIPVFGLVERGHLQDWWVRVEPQIGRLVIRSGAMTHYDEILGRLAKTDPGDVGFTMEATWRALHDWVQAGSKNIRG